MLAESVNVFNVILMTSAVPVSRDSTPPRMGLVFSASQLSVPLALPLTSAQFAMRAF